MSSDNYAGRLSEYPNKGICGLPESVESKRSLDHKLSKLITLLRQSNHVVVLTGAGVSTSAGIPDFRGPKGIWTQEMEMEKEKEKGKRKKKKNARKTSTGRKRKLNDGQSQSQSQSQSEETQAQTEETQPQQASFETAKPTLTHRAITALTLSGNDDSDTDTDGANFNSNSNSNRRYDPIIHYVITQNVDGLHMRSGLSRSKHCFLHGCIFTEKCEVCGKEYFREYDIGGVSFQKTGRKCTHLIRKGTKRNNGDNDGVKAEEKPRDKEDECIGDNNDGDGDGGGDGDGSKYEVCGGDLRDTILDWEDELPQDDWERAQEECAKSDLVLALGTSLRIEPAGSLPTLGEKFVIVNKQVTPYDSKAEMIIRAPVDDVFHRVMEELRGPNWDKKQHHKEE